MGTATNSSLSSSLRVVLAGLPTPFSPSRPPDVPLSGIAIDSRKVESGNLFVAMRGHTADGHDFIPQAIRRGAVAIVGEKPLEGLPVPYVRVENARRVLSYLAAAFYGNPAHRLTVIGVTGTDGKTTTCNLLYHVLRAAGLRVGLISTINAVIDEEVLDTGFHVTTPDAHDVQRYLAMMVNAGLTHAVLETTSHGWAQHRVDACEFDIGVITNITHEHLDEHGSYENYRAAKARLFQSLAETPTKEQGNPRLAVLNRDDDSYPYLREVVGTLASVHNVGYGLGATADVRAEAIEYLPQGMRFEVIGKGFRQTVATPLVGEFNIANILAALTAAIYGLGIAPAVAARGIAAMGGIPGRMERIDLGQSFTAIVDFAHTPNALRAALATVRRMTDRRIIAIFGSAGLRDKEKRRMMAEVAAELADVSILTAEDPRTESLTNILAEMAAGARNRGGVEGKTFFRVPDRREALRLGVRLAQAGDIVIACGKGHEQSMCFGTTEYPWDERVAMRAAIAECLGLPGPEMPYLPDTGALSDERPSSPLPIPER